MLVEPLKLTRQVSPSHQELRVEGLDGLDSNLRILFVRLPGFIQRKSKNQEPQRAQATLWSCLLVQQSKSRDMRRDP